jgi:hypothetical protein
MNPQDIFSSKFPHEYLDTMIRGLPSVYRTAYLNSFGEHASKQARDLFPHKLRCMVDEHLLSVARQCDGVRGRNRPNRARNSNHVEVISASAIITASRAKTPDHFVRRSNFREALATNNQLTLFPELVAELRGRRVYGIVLHGNGGGMPDKVEFVYLGIPDEDYSQYLFAIDLLEYYSIDLYSTIREEMVPDTAEPRIKSLPGRMREAK